MMNLSQTKLVGLTMELDLKTREYKKLCTFLDLIFYLDEFIFTKSFYTEYFENEQLDIINNLN